MDPAREVEQFVESLFGGIVATSIGTVTVHLVIAASGSVTWKTDSDMILRKLASDTAQNAVTTNGMTYTNLAALTAPANLGSQQVLVYSNAAVSENINAKIPKGTKLTVSVSSSGTQRMTLYFDLV